jgi:sugar O-acyltransferase (sialic acid O-acetyltransferase NeuD family)
MREKSMRNRLIIVGASGFGREVFCWATQIPESNRTWDIAGFLDDRKNELDGLNINPGIIGGPSDYAFRDNDLVVVALGDPEQRRKYAEIVESRGARFTSIMHPSVVIGQNNTWGDGCIFCPGAIITTNVRIGNHVIFNCQAGAGHDASISDYCTLSAFADITGHVKLGKGVFVGSHGSIQPRVTLEDDVTVGAGSVVFKNVSAGTTVIGVPAVPIWQKSNPTTTTLKHG